MTKIKIPASFAAVRPADEFNDISSSSVCRTINCGPQPMFRVEGTLCGSMHSSLAVRAFGGLPLHVYAALCSRWRLEQLGFSAHESVLDKWHNFILANSQKLLRQHAKRSADRGMIEHVPIEFRGHESGFITGVGYSFAQLGRRERFKTGDFVTTPFPGQIGSFALPVGEEEEWRMSRRFLVHKQPSRIYSKGDGI
jgi:hypothetical protein